MENENIMENNEVMEVAEEVVKSGNFTGLKLIGGALILGGAIYGGIKAIKKFKAKKEENYATCEADDDNIVDYENVDDEEPKSKK